jgi:uncharacterized protein YggE
MRLPALAVLACLAAPAMAQAETRLNLSASGSVDVTPDELRASLTAAASAATAAEAQAQVNGAVAKALAAAKSVPSVIAGTDAYSVWQETDPKDIWRASQVVALHGRDSEALLSLIGALQDQGLAVNDLGWQVSPALEEATYEQAMAKGVSALGARARWVAQLLHLTFIGFDSVTVGEPAGAMRPMPALRMMAVAKAPEPNATSDRQTVAATVTGVARLIPQP